MSGSVFAKLSCTLVTAKGNGEIKECLNSIELRKNRAHFNNGSLIKVEILLYVSWSVSNLVQLSGTEILDTIENETSGTLKKCYTALGE